MSVAKKIPPLRFKGFEGAWKSYEFGGVYERINAKKYQIESSRYLNLGCFPVVDQGKDLIVAYTNDANKVFSAAESPVIVFGDHTREVKFVEFDFAIGADGTQLMRCCANFEISFAYYVMKRLTLPNMGYSRHYKFLLEAQYLFPNLREQQKIASAFRSLDALIADRKSAVEKLQTLKKAMLEKMFPRAGAKVPEVRFEGFVDEWEERRLGEIGSPYNGLSGKCKSDFGHGDGRYVTYLNVFNNPVVGAEGCDRIEVDKSQNEVCDGDVFFTTSSETPEEVGMASVWSGSGNKTYLNSFCFGYRPKSKIITDFWAYMLRADPFRERIVVLAQGISRYNISKGKVMDLPVFLPKGAEQKKIGAYFRSLDALISARQEEVGKLKDLKKALLDRMFV